MRIIGIDPGYAIVGFGVLEYNRAQFQVVDYGAVTTPADMDFNSRLLEIYNDLCYILDKFRPDFLAIERLYFTSNQKTAIDVAQAREGKAAGTLLLGITKNLFRL